VTSNGCCPIDVSGAASGTVSAGGSQTFLGIGEGENVTVSADDSAVCCEFDSWSDAGAQTHTITMDSDKNVTAYCSVLGPFTISASAGANGNIAPSGAVVVNCGADQTFNITADACYEIEDVVVDGSPVGAVASYTFTNVAANHTISATFSAITYTLTVDVTPGGGGNVTVNGTTPSGYPDTTTWTCGEEVTVNAVAAGGYSFVNWSGDLNGSANSTNITMDGDKSVTANFEEILSPVLNVTPLSLHFVSRKGVTNPANQTLTITNTGGGTLAWTASDDAGWLTMDVTDGNLTAGQHNVSVISVNSLVPELAVGTYTGNITITGSTVVVPVELEIQEATTIVVQRDLPPDALDYDAEYPGDTFWVYVNFTSPVADFNAIGLNDYAPEGWEVETNVSWCTPAADYTKSPYNKAEYSWEGPFAKDVNFTAVYKVTIPATAVPGLSTWGGNCTGRTLPCPPCEGSPITLYEVWVDYWFAAQGPYESPIMGECQKIVTVPGCVVGETRDVNGDLLDTVLVTLYENPPGTPPDIEPEDTDSSSIVINVTAYENCADDTGYYYQIATKYCYKTVNSRPQGDGGTIPGVRNPNYPDYIDWTTPELLAAGAVMDFVGDYGLVCKAASMSYAMESINHHLFTPLDDGGTPQPDWKLSNWKAMESVASWQFPAGCSCC